MDRKTKTCIWGITHDMTVVTLPDGRLKIKYRGDEEMARVVEAYMESKIVVSKGHVFVYPVWFAHARALPFSRVVLFKGHGGLIKALKSLYSIPVVVSSGEIHVLSK